MNKESLRIKVPKGVEDLVLDAVSKHNETIGNFLLDNVHRSLYGTENLEEAKRHLKEGSILFYFNHFAKLDPILYGQIIRDYLNPSQDEKKPLEHVAGITSLRHIDPEKGFLSAVQAELIEGWSETFGINAIPVIQTKDKKDYPQADSFNRNAVIEAARFLRQQGNVLAISPEGTRSTLNELLEAEEGFEVLFKLGGKKVLALPAAGVHGTIRPYNTKTKVSVGKPFSFEEIQRESQDKGESITELAMQRLAALLPEQNRGYYL
ncbi:MAG TPA: hypothetical protein VES68_00660 [Candidatus Sulfotelmatobacter sp.]|nr:hypothetical protein [Candidatus Sulfotelmatobacter sp.]